MSVTMSTPEIIGGIIMLIACVALIIIISLQESPGQGGMSALTGGDSYFGQNKSGTREERLSRVTRALVSVFFIVTIVVYIIAS